MQKLKKVIAIFMGVLIAMTSIANASYVANDPVNATDPNGEQADFLSVGTEQINRARALEAASGLSFEEALEQVRQNDAAAAPFGLAAGGIGAAAIGGCVAGGCEAAALSLTAGRGFAQSGKFIQAIAKSGGRTGGRSGRRTSEFRVGGGEKGANKLFDKLTGGNSSPRDGGRLGKLGDGSRVQISSRTLKDGTKETSVRISRERTGSRIRDEIKVRFKEDPE